MLRFRKTTYARTSRQCVKPAPHTLELLNKGSDLLKDRLLLGLELRVQGAHLGQHRVEFVPFSLANSA
jgi:hypothetical protein